MSATSKKSLLVVVAEDEPAMLNLVASHLRRLGFTVHDAADGASAWKLIEAHKPDLIMLDVMMPEMSGWEVAKLVKAPGAVGGALANTPVLMLTGIGESMNAMTSPLFADGWLDKPFEFNKLDEKIREMLEKYGKQMPVKGAAAAPQAKPAKKVAAKPEKATAKKASKAPAKTAAKKAGGASKASATKKVAASKAVAKKARAAARRS